MNALDWIAAVVVIGSLLYLTFALTVPQWLQLLRKARASPLAAARRRTGVCGSRSP
jgi:hypothetical protein